MKNLSLLTILMTLLYSSFAFSNPQLGEDADPNCCTCINDSSGTRDPNIPGGGGNDTPASGTDT